MLGYTPWLLHNMLPYISLFLAVSMVLLFLCIIYQGADPDGSLKKGYFQYLPMQTGVTMRFALEYLLEGLVCVLLSLSIHYSAGELALAIFLGLAILATLVLFCYRCTQSTLKKSNYAAAKGDKQDFISQICCWRTRTVKLSKELEYAISMQESR